MSKAPHHDLLIRNVHVVRPHGNVVHEADIAVKGGRTTWTLRISRS